MKKFLFVAIAVIMAFGISAFTPASKFTLVYYTLDGGMNWKSANVTPCTSGSIQSCSVNVGSDGTQQIYQSQNLNSPYTWDGN